MTGEGLVSRILLVAANSGEGPLTEPTAAAQARWPEPVFMPHSRRSRSCAIEVSSHVGLRDRVCADDGGSALHSACSPRMSTYRTAEPPQLVDVSHRAFGNIRIALLPPKATQSPPSRRRFRRRYPHPLPDRNTH